MKSSQFYISFLLCLTALALLMPGKCSAQPQRASVNQAIPIAITADTMNYEPEKDRVVFRGNVEAVRADFTMWAAQLTLYLKPSDKPAPKAADGTEGESPQDAPAPLLDPALDPGDLDRIIAEKNVRFRYNTQSGTAAKATYTIDTGILVMEGDPTLRDGENSITGNVIRYFLNENRSEVESSGNRRVQAVFGSGASPVKN